MLVAAEVELYLESGDPACANNGHSLGFCLKEFSFHSDVTGLCYS